MYPFLIFAFLGFFGVIPVTVFGYFLQYFCGEKAQSPNLHNQITHQWILSLPDTQYLHFTAANHMEEDDE